jgi:hypothetical protein
LPNIIQAKNVILMIGDGMGPEQIKAGRLLKGEELVFENFPYFTKVETRSRDNAVTDSAAAATAMATGKRTNNGIIGKDKDGNDLETIVDFAASLGKRTGSVVTEALDGATPMGFSGHAESRKNSTTLLESAAKSSNVNLFASSTINVGFFKSNGYEQIENADFISESNLEKIIGSYNILATYYKMYAEGGNVSFDRLVTEALEYLSKDKDVILAAKKKKIL